MNRDGYYRRDISRDRDRSYRNDKDHGYDEKRRSVTTKRSPTGWDEKRRSRSRTPRKSDKDFLDDKIMRELNKIPTPSELWDTPFQETTNITGSGPYNPDSQSAPPVDFTSNYQSQTSYSGIYEEFPAISALGRAPPEWNQMSLPPPPAQPAPYTIEEQIKKDAAIETEMRHQKAALSKQREDYIKKSSILKKELETLKDQRNELRGDSKRSPSPDTKRFLKENTKLQLEIQNKLKTINNVVDMLNGIIGEEAQGRVEIDDTERSSKRKSRSPSYGKKFNYVYYDPEMHWCRVCNEFPANAKDYLNHLHSPGHHKMAAAHTEAPWHGLAGAHEPFPAYPHAPTKRTPIKGLQFFVPSTAWYCKLCDQFIGDLHCASAHLKSLHHAKNYTNFVEQNPHWETDWMSDRQKALEKSRMQKMKIDEKPKIEEKYTSHTITFHKDGFHTKNRKSPFSDDEREEKERKKDKKKKGKKRKKSSSESSNSSESDQDRKKHKSKSKSEAAMEDKLISEWMSSIKESRLSDSDRKLLDSLKTKIKHEKVDKRSPEHHRNREPSHDKKNFREIERRERILEEKKRDERERERDEREKERLQEEIEKETLREERERQREHRERERARERDRLKSKEKRIEATVDAKKVEKKMPFIGKMPVYKSLGQKPKVEEIKKEDTKKKDEDEAIKKKREELDAEIQRKVAEFKSKIAQAQLEREAAEAVPEIMIPHPPPPVANLPQDFQDALDIIFPTPASKQQLQQDVLHNIQQMSSGFPPIMPGMPPHFPPMMPQMPPQMPQMPPQMPPQFMNFDMNNPLYQPRGMTQLYDSHVPIVPGSKQKPANKTFNNRNQNQNKLKKELPSNGSEKAQESDVKKEVMDDLAMLGMDASDVGAGC